MNKACGDGDDAAEPGGHICLAVIVDAPCDDCAVAFEGEAVSAAGGNADDTGEPKGGLGGAALV